MSLKLYYEFTNTQHSQLVVSTLWTVNFYPGQSDLCNNLGSILFYHQASSWLFLAAPKELHVSFVWETLRAHLDSSFRSSGVLPLPPLWLINEVQPPHQHHHYHQYLAYRSCGAYSSSSLIPSTWLPPQPHCGGRPLFLLLMEAGGGDLNKSLSSVPACGEVWIELSSIQTAAPWARCVPWRARHQGMTLSRSSPLQWSRALSWSSVVIGEPYVPVPNGIGKSSYGWPWFGINCQKSPWYFWRHHHHHSTSEITSHHMNITNDLFSNTFIWLVICTWFAWYATLCLLIMAPIAMVTMERGNVFVL